MINPATLLADSSIETEECGDFVSLSRPDQFEVADNIFYEKTKSFFTGYAKKTDDKVAVGVALYKDQNVTIRAYEDTSDGKSLDFVLRMNRWTLSVPISVEVNEQLFVGGSVNFTKIDISQGNDFFPLRGHVDSLLAVVGAYYKPIEYVSVGASHRFETKTTQGTLHEPFGSYTGEIEQTDLPSLTTVGVSFFPIEALQLTVEQFFHNYGTEADFSDVTSTRFGLSYTVAKRLSLSAGTYSIPNYYSTKSHWQNDIKQAYITYGATLIISDFMDLSIAIQDASSSNSDITHRDALVGFNLKL